MKASETAKRLLQLIEAKVFVSRSPLYWTTTVTFLRSVEQNEKPLKEHQVTYLSNLEAVGQFDLLRASTAERIAANTVLSVDVAEIKLLKAMEMPEMPPLEEPKFISLTEYLKRNGATI